MSSRIEVAYGASASIALTLRDPYGSLLPVTGWTARAVFERFDDSSAWATALALSNAAFTNGGASGLLTLTVSSGNTSSLASYFGSPQPTRFGRLSIYGTPPSANETLLFQGEVEFKAVGETVVPYDATLLTDAFTASVTSLVGGGVTPVVDDTSTTLLATADGRPIWGRVVLTPEQFAPAGVTLGTGNKTQDQAAFDACVSAAVALGNCTIVLAFGRTYTLDYIEIDGAEGVVIDGMGGHTFNFGGLLFDGTNPRIRFRSSKFSGMRGVRIRVTHSGLSTTDFLMMDHGVSGSDSSGLRFEDLALMGPSDKQLRRWINCKDLINSYFAGLTIQDCQYGIDLSSDGYAVNVTITRKCVFVRCEQWAIFNPNERNSITHCTFEPRDSDGMVRALGSDRFSLALHFSHNWFGDSATAGSVCVYLHSPFGAEINNNRVQITGANSKFLQVRGGSGIRVGDGNALSIPYGVEFVGPEDTLNAHVGPNQFTGLEEVKGLDAYGVAPFVARLDYEGELQRSVSSLSVNDVTSRYLAAATQLTAGGSGGIQVDSAFGTRILGLLHAKPLRVLVAAGTNADLNSFAGIIFLAMSGAPGAFTTNGWLQGDDGQLFFAVNLTGQLWTVPHESGSEAIAARRIVTPTGANMTDLAGKGVGVFIRDANTSRFRFYPLYGF